jgi:PIN domain nuclease of toxin-antitoxin system
VRRSRQLSRRVSSALASSAPPVFAEEIQAREPSKAAIGNQQPEYNPAALRSVSRIACQEGNIADEGLRGRCPPADRLIVATARVTNATLMTRDRHILDYAARGHLDAVAA